MEEPIGTVGMSPNKFLAIIVLAVSFIGDFFPIQMATRIFLEVVNPNLICIASAAPGECKSAGVSAI